MHFFSILGFLSYITQIHKIFIDYYSLLEITTQEIILCTEIFRFYWL